MKIAILMLLLSSLAMAQTKVVVIPIVGDDGIEPFAPVAKESPPDSDYVVGMLGVFDKTTGLEWQKFDDSILRNWNDASNYCANLSQESVYWRISKDDWWLPSVSELLSIVS